MSPINRMRRKTGRRKTDIVNVDSVFDGHVAEIDFPGMSAFNTDSFFTEGGMGKFFFIGDDFRSWFGGMEVMAAMPSKLSLDHLRGDPHILDNLDIIREIGEENCDLSLGFIRWHMEKRGNLTRDLLYAGYAVDNNGVRRVIHWGWNDIGFFIPNVGYHIRADNTVDPRGDMVNTKGHIWRASWSDSFFISRKPLVTQTL